MQQLLPSLIDPPIMFAHRGASAHARENTMEAFRLALRLGATGIETDVWLTADGVAVLDHDGALPRSRRFGRRRPIALVRRDELPDHIPTLAELLEGCGTDYHLSIDLKDSRSGRAVIDVVREIDADMLPRVWLCHPEVDVLTELRPYDDTVRLVDSTRLERIGEGPERRAARLSSLGIDAINMRRPDWNGGLVTLFHRFGLAAFCWDVHHEHQLRPAFRMGVDAVYSDHVDRMVDAFKAELGNG